MSILDTLNSEQRRAVEVTDGPVVIIAGPGTGKTKTLTTRIEHLLHEGVKPDHILALTFTNKAAKEMRDRLTSVLNGHTMPTIATFHALAAKLLPRSDAQLLTDVERSKIIKQLKKHYASTVYSERDLGLLISQTKNQTEVSADEFLRNIVYAYNDELTARNLYDFDDVLIQLHRHLEHNKSAFTHILVDEFQDTNQLQYDILRRLSSTGNIFVIGDPAQSIYGFRGANADIFDAFLADWPQATRINLTTNYRSTAAVVQAACAVFPSMPKLHAHRTAAGTVQAVAVLNEYREADWIIRHIEQQLGGTDMSGGSSHQHSATGRGFGDFAILYRTHSVAKTLQRALDKSGIPYQVAGEGSPFMRPHIQVIVQSLAYMTGKQDAPVYKQLSAVQTARLLEGITPDDLGRAVDAIIERFDLNNDKTASDIRQYRNSLLRYKGMPTSDYADHMLAIAEQEYYDPSASCVSLMTIHAAKGLEFSQVYLIAAENGTVPLAKKGQVGDMSEERRLFYVALTRAKDDMYMLHAKSRNRAQQTLSDFATALPTHLLQRIIDEDMAKQVKNMQRKEQKRAQGSLF